MKNMKRITAITMVAGGLVAAGAGVASADSGAEGIAAHSPGVASGNVIQVPVHVPINLCGNTVTIIGALNPTLGNACVNQ